MLMCKTPATQESFQQHLKSKMLHLLSYMKDRIEEGYTQRIKILNNASVVNTSRFHLRSMAPSVMPTSPVKKTTHINIREHMETSPSQNHKHTLTIKNIFVTQRLSTNSVSEIINNHHQAGIKKRFRNNILAKSMEQRKKLISKWVANYQ
jgi:actin-related protein